MNDSLVGPKLCTPKNGPCNALACDDSDGEVNESEFDSIDDIDAEPAKWKSNYNGYLDWITQRQWITGEHAVVEDSDI